ncbi:MAG: PilZ domain-containing protein [Candidatus Omnitrophica bacterium]|nr:PilZ domain-containing protein [Candidatus Omnitrophota bacterium]
MENLADKLVSYNWINAGQLNAAKQDASKTGKSVWSCLVKLGHLSEEDIAIFFSQESGIAYVRVDDYELDREILCLVNEAFCRQHAVIPVFKIKNVLYVACSNPLDTGVIDGLSRLSGCEVEPLIASSRSILAALDICFGPEDENFLLDGFLFRQNPLQGLSFYRESQRLALSIPAGIKVLDKSVRLHCSSIEGYTRNISSNGKAINLQVSVFLPRGISVSLELKPQKTLLTAGEIIKAFGEVIYCNVEKVQRYSLAVKFINIAQDDLEKLLKLANNS